MKSIKLIKLFFILFLILFVAVSIVNFYLLTKKDYDCSDFATYKDAVKVFKKNVKDIYDLDRNGNGKPCELLLTK
jgi:hypothetical protein